MERCTEFIASSRRRRTFRDPALLPFQQDRFAVLGDRARCSLQDLDHPQSGHGTRNRRRAAPHTIDEVLDLYQQRFLGET